MGCNETDASVEDRTVDGADKRGLRTYECAQQKGILHDETRAATEETGCSEQTTV